MREISQGSLHRGNQKKKGNFAADMPKMPPEKVDSNGLIGGNDNLSLQEQAEKGSNKTSMPLKYMVCASGKR